MNYEIITITVDRADVELLVAFWRMYSYFPRRQRNAFRSIVNDKLKYLSKALNFTTTAQTFRKLVDMYDTRRMKSNPNIDYLFTLRNPTRMLTFLDTIFEYNFKIMYLLCECWPLNVKLGDFWIQDYIDYYSDVLTYLRGMLSLHSVRRSK